MTNLTTDSANDSIRKRKNRIGIVAIALLLLFTVLAILGYINFLEWIFLDLAVAFLANMLLRRINRQTL